MAIEFHDGSKALLKKYCDSKKWNDPGLLWLNGEASVYDKWLIEQNTEENLTRLLNTAAVTEIRPYGKGDKLGTLIGLADQSMLVVKGLHQWVQVERNRKYNLHITLGLDGRLWHLDALYTQQSKSLAFSGNLSAGESLSDETHDGWTIKKK